MTADAERIKSLDYIRGLSILGILLVNAIAFAQPFAVYANPTLSTLPLSHTDLVTWWVIETFFKMKFISSFNMLFGVSMFLVGRDQGPGVTGTPLFRRLLWMVVFGLIHGALIWHGDILLAYAVTGFVFWRWRAVSAQKLLLWGGFLFLTGAVIQLWPLIDFQPGTVDTAPAAGPIIAAMRGSFWDSLAQNVADWASTIFLELIMYLPTTLGLMMLGLGLFKLGILSGVAKTRTYLLFVLAGMISLAIIGWQSWMIVQSNFAFPQSFGIGAIANTVLCLPVAIGYAAALILLGRTKPGAILLYPLACAGRMAFTNYLCQSLIMTAIFYGGRGGPALFGTMNHAALVPIVVAIWLGQLVFSMLWLLVFRYGPFEWVWRCLTYRRWIPLLTAKAAT